jgi:cytochrome c peroxidase
MRAYLPAIAWGSLVALGCDQSAQVQALRDRAADLELAPLEAVEDADPALVRLGRNLFFDPILSGNRDQACVTCHAPEHALGDGRSLAVGTASVLRDGKRTPGPDHTFTPRNAPPLWDLGQPESTVLFWDGRLAPGEDGELVMYETGHEASEVVRLYMPSMLDSTVSAQAMLPVLDRDEMRGEVTDDVPFGEENELARIVDRDFEGIWDALLQRLLAIDAYRSDLLEAYPEVVEEDLGFEHAAQAIGVFVGSAFQVTGTPWDRFLAGEDDVLDAAQVRGALLFYGEGTCSTCHSGSLFSDQDLYNLGVRPMTSGPSELENVDLGAAHRTHTRERYTFRTPRLRNVALTGPWMHNGAFTKLEDAVRHHLDPVRSALNYSTRNLRPDLRKRIVDAPEVQVAILKNLAPKLRSISLLNDTEVEQLLAFLKALTDPAVKNLADVAPYTVPSGLKVDRPES